MFQLMMSEEKERAVEEARVLGQEVMLLAAGRTIASKHKDTKFSHLVNFPIVAKHSGLGWGEFPILEMPIEIILCMVERTINTPTPKCRLFLKIDQKRYLLGGR